MLFLEDEILNISQMKYVLKIDQYETIHQLFSLAENRVMVSDYASIMKESDILAGDYPSNIDEVMISQDLALRLNLDEDETINLTTIQGDSYPFTISGITNKTSSTVYFHDSFFTDEHFVFSIDFTIHRHYNHR